MLEGIRARYEELGIKFPEVVISDNCCHIESPVKGTFPLALSLLDVKHFGARYVSRHVSPSYLLNAVDCQIWSRYRKRTTKPTVQGSTI